MIQVEMLHRDGTRETHTSGDADYELTVAVGQALDFMKKRGLTEFVVRTRED